MLLGPDISRLEPSIGRGRAERKTERLRVLDRLYRWLSGWSRPGVHAGKSGDVRRFVWAVNDHADEMASLDGEVLSERVRTIRSALRRNGLKPRHVAHAFALIREVAHRELGLRHYDTQLVGGWLLLRGMVAEMPTGEGKTLAATLTAGTAAMAGLPVHVLTVNDYLTDRDATEMQPVYRALGLSVGTVVHGKDNEARKAAYASDVVYCTSREVVFDYLRDRIALGKHRHPLQQKVEPIFGDSGSHHSLLTRGLHYAIVDEADSIMIDEARTPLIISGPVISTMRRSFLGQAMGVAAELVQDEDFRKIPAERRIELTPQGVERLRGMVGELGPLWSGQIRREEVVNQALTALHLFHRDKHYLIRDGKVEIIDQLTGRVAEGRSWERGLHQLIELKEGCEPTPQLSTIARISYQSFFQRYLHLSGMTGTASEVRRELWQVYHLPVSSVPHHRPCIRQVQPSALLADGDSKWQRIAERARALVAEGRPVLVGTASVAASEAVAERFEAEGLPYCVLNAKQDREEAKVISRAGLASRITIATSMAGRGTDIKLDNAVTQAGGLHVILSECFDAARVDRQLAGRCGRQGDPGSFEAILSLEDVTFISLPSRWLARVAIMLGVQGGPGRLLGRFALRGEQLSRELKSRKERAGTRRYDEKQEELLSISGRAE